MGREKAGLVRPISAERFSFEASVARSLTSGPAPVARPEFVHACGKGIPINTERTAPVVDDGGRRAHDQPLYSAALGLVANAINHVVDGNCASARGLRSPPRLAARQRRRPRRLPAEEGEASGEKSATVAIDREPPFVTPDLFQIAVRPGGVAFPDVFFQPARSRSSCLSSIFSASLYHGASTLCPCTDRGELARSEPVADTNITINVRSRMAGHLLRTGRRRQVVLRDDNRE